MTDQTCSKCDADIDRPYRENANYVVSDDFIEPREEEVTYVMWHTDETWKRLQELDEKIENQSRAAIGAEMADPDAPETKVIQSGSKRRFETADGDVIENYVQDEIEFSYPAEEFDHVETDDPSVVKRDRMAAYAYTVVEERDVEKTGVICPGCLADDDEIIWGVDK